MQKIKIFTVFGKTPADRAEKIEKVQNSTYAQCKGSIYYEFNNFLYADIFFIDNGTPSSGNTNLEKKEFKVSEETLKRWKKIRPTKKTYGLLISKGFSKEEINHIKSQYEAHIILENLKEENI